MAVFAKSEKWVFRLKWSKFQGFNYSILNGYNA